MSLAIQQTVRAMIRSDGGSLFVVKGIDREGRSYTSEGFCNHDAGVFARDLRFNGWTEVRTEQVR